MPRFILFRFVKGEKSFDKNTDQDGDPAIVERQQATNKFTDWIRNVKNILCESGFTFVWLQQETVKPKWLNGVLHKRLDDINRQKWHNEMNVNSHCESYQMFKDNLRCEPYITLLNTRQRITLCKFRWGNTNIPIVSG